MDKFGPELLVIQFGFLVILSTLFLWLWFSNRRKYHNLKHAIPANVVRNYLDSIIQNSTSLKSSLFRGGGLDVNNVPSVMPLNHLIGGEGLGINGAPSTELMEEINQKKAIVASLEAQLSSLKGSQKEMEVKFTSSQTSLSSAESKIKELEALLSKTKATSGGDEALKAELTMVTKERDELRDRLREFEIIADDLANLKRLQQENAQLKRSLAAQGGAPIEIPKPNENVAVAKPEVSDLLDDLDQSNSEGDNDNQALEDFLSSPDEINEEATDKSSNEEPLEASSAEEGQEDIEEISAAGEQVNEEGENETKPKTERTPEDLLSEFEKMLG
jgi:predicted  nucleic acid-binding Zn-ribbon protein